MIRLRTLSFALALSAGGAGVADAAPRAADATIVALGASSTAGRGVGARDTYPAQLEAMLRSAGYGVRVLNAGVNGDTSSGMLARLDADVPEGTTLVILQTGTNDARADGHDGTIEAIVGRLRARRIGVVRLRTPLMRDLRDRYARADGHHLTAEGYRVLAARLLPLVERALAR